MFRQSKSLRKETHLRHQVRVRRYSGITHGGSAGGVRITSEERTRLGQMADHLERCCNDLHDAGYDIISITPIVSGRTSFMDTNSQREFPGHGYSVTDGLIVTGRLREQEPES